LASQHPIELLAADERQILPRRDSPPKPSLALTRAGNFLSQINTVHSRQERERSYFRGS
jgi:hypothetical protein